MDEAVGALHIDGVGRVPPEDSPGARKVHRREGGEQSTRLSGGADEIAIPPAPDPPENVPPQGDAMAICEAAARKDELRAVLNERDEFADGAVAKGRAAAVATGRSRHQPWSEGSERVDVEVWREQQARVGTSGLGGEMVSLPRAPHLEGVTHRRAPRDVARDQAGGHAPTQQVGSGADGDDRPCRVGRLVGEVRHRHGGLRLSGEHDLARAVEAGDGMCLPEIRRRVETQTARNGRKRRGGRL